MDIDRLFQAHHKPLILKARATRAQEHVVTNTNQDDHGYAKALFVCSHLSVEPDGEDVVGVAVVANLCTFLEMIDVHSPRHGEADHNHQTAGEQSLHYVDIRTLHWEGKREKSLITHIISHLFISSERGFTTIALAAGTHSFLCGSLS